MASIYISGFDDNTDEDILRKHFDKIGTISDLYFQSKGSAVITYDDSAVADRAVAEINGTTMKGQQRYVSVKLDDPDRKTKGKGEKGKKGEKGGKSSKGKGKSSGYSGSGAAVYASGFDYGTDEIGIKKHFGTVGRIKDLYFQSNGSAVITYEDSASADRAVEELSGTTMKGQQRYVSVKLDDPDREGGDKGKGKGKKGDKGKGKGKSSSKGGGKSSGTAVYASGFDYETDDAAARKHFGTVGQITELYFQSKGAAVITYEDEHSANRAVAELDGTTIKGQQRYVAVHLDVRSKGGKGKSR